MRPYSRSSFYEDLYHLVCFIPSLNLPSGIVSGQDANNASDPKSRKVRHQGSLSSSELLNSSQSPSPTSTAGTQCPAPPHSSSHSHPTYPPIPLLPAHCPPKFRWAETFPAKYFVNSRRRQAAEGRKSMRRKMQAAREGGGVGQNVPLEVALFMSSWVSELQRRKTIDAPLTTAMLNTLLSLSEALASLERILTTPIPWSYSAHIWEITYIYCLLLPFQLEGAGFGWLTIPGTVVSGVLQWFDIRPVADRQIVAYIVIGFAEIGEEIENPFVSTSTSIYSLTVKPLYHLSHLTHHRATTRTISTSIGLSKTSLPKNSQPSLPDLSANPVNGSLTLRIQALACQV